jgi:hypothetical protein
MCLSATYLIRANSLLTYAQEPRTEAEEKSYSSYGDAPDFVEVGEAGIAMDDAMRRQRRVQLVG